MDLPVISSTEKPTLNRKASSVESVDMSAIQARKTRKRIPSDEWERKRPIITKLYQVEKRSLKEMMDIMERDYGFTATVKMYKSRIWKWGLDKKLKSDEVLAVLILKQERDAQRKPTQFTIRGQPVDLDNINRYVKRSPHLRARFRAGQAPSVQTSREVSCYTPPPSPTRSLPPPGQTQRVDEIMQLFRDYVEGSLSSFAWDWQYNVDCIGRVPGDRSEELVERVLASFALVNRCLSRGDEISVEGVLSPAFESLEEIVAAESPIFVARTVCLLWYLERHQKRDLLQAVINYIANVAPMVLGSNHMLSRIWQVLRTSYFTDYHELAMCVYSMLIPLMEERIGPANYLTTVLYGDHIDCIVQQNRSHDALAMSGRYRSKVDATGQSHPWLVELAITQTAVLCAKRESEGLIGDAMECLQTLRKYPMTEDQQAVVDIQMGNYSHRLGNTSSAISSYKRAARLALAARSDERLLTTCLTNLEIALSKHGMAYEADRVRNYRLERIAEFSGQVKSYLEKPYVLQSNNSSLHPVDCGESYDNRFSADDSRLWQDQSIHATADIMQNGPFKDIHPAPIDTAMRWIDCPSETDGWGRAAPLTQATVPAMQYSSMNPLMSVAWQPDVFQ